MRNPCGITMGSLSGCRNYRKIGFAGIIGNIIRIIGISRILDNGPVDGTSVTSASLSLNDNFWRWSPMQLDRVNQFLVCKSSREVQEECESEYMNAHTFQISPSKFLLYFFIRRCNSALSLAFSFSSLLVCQSWLLADLGFGSVCIVCLCRTEHNLVST